MFKQAEEALPQLRILLQIRRVVFYIKCKYFLIFMIYLAFSKFGQLRIEAKRQPEFKTFLGFAMLFSAEWDWIVVLEYFRAIYHFLSPPMAEGGTAEAAKEAMKFTLTLGFSCPVYALVGLSGLLHVFSRTSTYY
jgi:choline/glycine/proline betaine transport protein